MRINLFTSKLAEGRRVRGPSHGPRSVFLSRRRTRARRCRQVTSTRKNAMALRGYLDGRVKAGPFVSTKKRKLPK